MTITATELKYNLGKYLDLANSNDISIKRNGKVIAILSNPNKDRFQILQNLKGIIANDIDADTFKKERLSEK